MVFYPNPINVGLKSAKSCGDGYTINLLWHQAYPSLYSNKIAYNIYYSTIKEHVFSEGIKYVSVDDLLEANIIDLTPGQLYFFSIRPVEYNPTTYNLSTILPIAYDNLRIIPFSLLSSDITATDLTIPLLDTYGFPSEGIIIAGAELINYTSANYLLNELYVPDGETTNAYLIEQIDGYYSKSIGNDGYLIGLSLIDTKAEAQNWKIECINIPLDGYGLFTATGSISGISMEGYTNPYIWKSDGYVISDGILQFSITQNTPFSLGDYFIVKVGGSSFVDGGRGYNNTIASIHTTSGSDGNITWSPVISYFVLGEEKVYDRIFMCQSRFEYPNFQRTNTDGYHQVTKDLLTTDLSVSDEYNEDFPPYDYSGYHRTDPVQLIDGTCVGSYIGGENGCIDKYGNYQILRGFSLQDSNNQRQELGLSVDGRPAVLIKRVRTGITCACYQPSSEYPDDRCPLCFAEGTLINTKNGFVPIEKINKGDFVLSGDGTFKKVLNTFSNDYVGDLNSITTTTTTNPILCTPEHQIFKVKSNHYNKNGCGPNSNCLKIIQRDYKDKGSVHKLTSGNWQARATAKNHNRVSLGTFGSKLEAQNAIRIYLQQHSVPSHFISLDKAINITNKDWLVNIWDRKVDDVTFAKTPNEFIGNSKNIVFKVDEGFCWIIGLYLAEGSTGKRSINFALDKSEVTYQNKILNYFSNYGYNGKVYKTSENGVSVEIYGASLSRWFSNLFGKGCDNKKISNNLMNLSDNKSQALINGIFDGDGCKRDDELIQTSEILALQISEILHRLGYLPTIRKIVNKTKTINGNLRKTAYCISKGLTIDIKQNRKGRWHLNENYLTKVKRNESIPYKGKIYNLEVDGEHSYVVQNILVKNCYGTKFVFGYEQYFNPRRSDGRILVRPGPADEDLKMTESGLESELILDFWTLTVPTIKDRDIIILFDMDGNEEFRYEVLSVTRNNTVLGLQGGQKFKAQRIRKFDPAYQIRVFRDSSMFPSQLNTSIGFTTGILPHTHKITRNETDISNWSQTTSISRGHNHPVIYKNNILMVLSAVGHTHTIIV